MTRRDFFTATAVAALFPLPTQSKVSAMAARPFTIAVPDAVLEDLETRLRLTRWPDRIEGAAWDYGIDTDRLRPLVEHWAEGFDWRAVERDLNALPQFVAEVDGEAIHFIHATGQGGRRVPLLVLHGWPSSFLQMTDLIPLLTAERAGLSFDVIVPSLPGFGFSAQPRTRGMGVARIAGLMTRLMTGVLGYDRFAGRGSDLGAGVLQQIALQSPDRLMGLHLSGTNPYIGHVPDDLSPEEAEFVARAQAWMQSEMAYAMLHASKPDTLAVALNDSPAGLAAWVLEKFHAWTDADDFVARYGRDRLLANLTLYWATGTIGSSMRLYYETLRAPGQWGRVAVPTAMLMTPHDMFATPRAWAERSYNVQRWTDIDRGGHFLEWEEAAIVADDMRDWFRGQR
ncbi:MAG: epoxide hydrolase [Paracoccaceae bacterium]|nr:MAG: epoxide hydrolase [Paracoccaceae bacterium]